MADIAELYDATEQKVTWALQYYEQWGSLANIQQQSALENFFKHPNIGQINDLLKEHDGYKTLIKKGGMQVANKAAISSLNRLVAQEIVKASVGGAVSATGRRAAVAVVEETATLAVSRGANMALTGVKLASLPVGISSAIGEMVGDALADAVDIKNHHGKNAMGAGGAIGGGAAAGAVVGGPIGAAAGAAIGAGSWAVGQGIKALLNTTKGPKGNKCYIEVGDIGSYEICFGTYNENDTMYWHTYWKEYKKSGGRHNMSAGQPTASSFQLCIWHGNKVIKHFNHVYHRDKIGVIRRGGKFRVVHCKGEYHPSTSGEVLVFEK